jgi:hypothetical protein
MQILPVSAAESNARPIASDPIPPVADRISAPDAAPDPFDPARLRLGQDFSAAVGVRKVLTTVPCRKPWRQEFIRVRPGEEWRLETGLFEDRINRDVYLVGPELWPELAAEVYPAFLFTTITRQGNVFLWPCRLPGVDGRTNTWNESAFSAARIAELRWVRLSANMAAGLYDVHESVDALAEPEWPAASFHELLKLSFKDRLIQSLDHPILKALRGEA